LRFPVISRFPRFGSRSGEIASRSTVRETPSLYADRAMAWHIWRRPRGRVSPVNFPLSGKVLRVLWARSVRRENSRTRPRVFARRTADHDFTDCGRTPLSSFRGGPFRAGPPGYGGDRPSVLSRLPRSADPRGIALHHPGPPPSRGRVSDVSGLREALPLDGGGLGGGGPGTDVADSRVREDGLIPGGKNTGRAIAFTCLCS
jgi:hypothetical protein